MVPYLGESMRFLVHEAFKDVFIERVRTTYRGANYQKMKVRWWNLGYTGQPWLLDPRPQTITILNSEWKRWSAFNPSQPETHPGRKNV